MTTASQRPGYFDALYAADPDPWGFKTRAYESDKYAATIAALPAKRFRSALEIGCSIGVLSEQLATRCDALLGIDIADAALASARDRCRYMAHVRFERSTLPARAPEGQFDLIVLSEVLYYFTADEIAMLSNALMPLLMPDTVIMLVHWLGPTPDYPLTGETAVAAFKTAMSDLTTLRQLRTPQYRLDVLGFRPD
jgi:trans-aconitate methyltransferase